MEEKTDCASEIPFMNVALSKLTEEDRIRLDALTFHKTSTIWQAQGSKREANRRYQSNDRFRKKVRGLIERATEAEGAHIRGTDFKERAA